MVRRLKLGRRRDDNRVAKKNDYALIQDAELDNELAIPHYDANHAAKPESTDKLEETETLPTSEIPETPSVFALMGATGGVGTTSLATQLAYEFARSAKASKQARFRSADPTVCLIDLDFEAGSCAHHLDLLPSLSLEDLCGPSEKIDPAFTQAIVSTHESGVSLLATPNTIGANARINPHTVMAMLDAAAELYDTVIIDMPRYHQVWTLPVMRAVDVLGLTCELTIPSLHAAREMLVNLSQKENGAVNTQVILNKFERRSFKNTLKLSDTETALGREILATLCLDPDTTRDALNCGEPAGVIHPDSRFVKDVKKLADAMRNQSISPIEKAA